MTENERVEPPPRARDRWVAPLRRARPELIAVVVVAVAYFALSARRHLLIESDAYDLGIFVQNVRGWAEATGPISQIKAPDFNLLGDHFSPILAVLAPLWWIWPSALVLLLAQAILLAIGVAPLMAWARHEWGLGAGILVAFLYSISFGLLAAINFDFHEVAFAVPLISFSVCFFGRARYRAALIAAAPLVLVKEDLGVTFIAVLGLLLLLRKQWLLGAIAIVGGFGATILAMTVFIPAVNPAGVYPYAGAIRLTDPLGMIRQLVASNEVKIPTALTTLAISCFIALRSPIVLLVLANLAARFISDRPADWGTFFHYSATNMPIVIAAMIAGLLALSRGDGPRSPVVRWALPTAIAVSLGVMLSAQGTPVPIKPSSWTGLFSPDAHVTAMRTALAMIPDGATVAASSRPAAQLAERATVSFFRPGTFSLEDINPEWIVVDTVAAWPEGIDARREAIEEAKAAGYQVRVDREGTILLERTN